MNQFFNVYLYDVTNNETIWFSKPDGSVTDVVILDDGWAPNVTKYVRDGEKTWSDVVEELECMTNVATRDEALALIEKLNALVHRAARDIEEKQAYTVRFVVKSQFSTAQNEAFTHVVSPPDDGNVITLSTDIQIAPPGQVRFRFTFKRTGAWITIFNDIIKNSLLYFLNYFPPSGVWEMTDVLPTSIKNVTPFSLSFSFYTSGSKNVIVKDLFICTNVFDYTIVDNFNWEAPFNMDIVIYPHWMFASGNMGFIIKDNTDYYTTDKRPYAFINLQSGTYAVFVSWRSVQPDVAHRLQIQFDNNTETSNILLLSKDTTPNYTYIGTLTMRTKANILYLRTSIGHSTGFEIEKIIFVKLKSTSSIVSLHNFIFIRNAEVIIQNSVLQPFKTVIQKRLVGSYELQEVLNTYESLDIVFDDTLLKCVAIGNSPDVFSLQVEPNEYYPVHALPLKIIYRTISTTFH